MLALASMALVGLLAATTGQDTGEGLVTPPPAERPAERPVATLQQLQSRLDTLRQSLELGGPVVEGEGGC